MAIFLVIPTDADSLRLVTAIKEQQTAAAIKYLELPRGEFFVSYKGTCQELSNLLKVTDGTSGGAVITSTNAYYGWAGNDIWEWVSTHWEG
ncbi:MAG: hypothetical protein K2Y25_14890 [Pseudomonadaceae bacterium]|nr:hypothetical protein [Pseudomonadaceae bacterium]